MGDHRWDEDPGYGLDQHCTGDFPEDEPGVYFPDPSYVYVPSAATYMGPSERKRSIRTGTQHATRADLGPRPPGLDAVMARRATLQEEPMSEFASLQLQAQQLMAKMATVAALEARFPSEPPEMTVLRWTQTFGRGGSERVYTYAALRVENSWHVTGGRESNEAVAWDDLKVRLQKLDVQIATEWADIPRPQVQTVDAETDPKKWLELVYGDPTKVLNGSQQGNATS